MSDDPLENLKKLADTLKKALDQQHVTAARAPGASDVMVDARNCLQRQKKQVDKVNLIKQMLKNSDCCVLQFFYLST